jgi:hypothetical protein
VTRFTLAVTLCFAACTSTPAADAGHADPTCSADNGAAALAECLTPTQTPSYYILQGNKYFDALDRSAPDASQPIYAENVARWEWPPWLKLTGYTRTQMQGTDKLVKTQAPAVVSHRDCRYFAVQPFCRCRVSFDYDNQGGGKGCAIYEEFVFNDAGEITFVEAWSDLPGRLPFTDKADLWGEGPGVHRMSAKIPGLGKADGKIDPAGAAMALAASQDAEIADFAARARDFWASWLDENSKAGPDYFKAGCGW